MKVLDNIQSKYIVSVDIETVRVVDKFEDLDAGTQSAWEYKNKNNGEIPTYEELCESWEKNSALYAEFSKVCAVSLTFLHEDKLYCKEFFGKDEKELLKALSITLDNMENKDAKYRLAGHASKFFDYPFLSKRYIINGLRIPNILDSTNAKPWEQKNLCTNELWKAGGTGAGSSLQALCNVLNIPISKVDLVGGEVGKAYYDNELERIGRYCSFDTVATFNVIRFFKQEPIFTFEEVSYIQEYIDGKEPETSEETFDAMKSLVIGKDFTIKIQKEIKKQLKGKSLTEVDKNNLKIIIYNAWLQNDFISGNQDSKAKKQEKQTEVDRFVDEL